MLTLFPFPRQLYSLLLLGVFDFASANKPTNITITDVSQTASNCPYSITAHFDTDLSHLELEFTSNDTYLIKLDDDPRECYTSVKYNHNGFNISLSTSSVDVRGSITLSKGVRTRIGTSISWQNDQRLQNFTTLSIRGPTPAGVIFGAHNYNDTEIHPGSCDPTTYQIGKQDTISIRSVFSIVRQGNESIDAVGTIGPKLKQILNLDWSDGCALPCYDCFYDKSGSKFCPKTPQCQGSN